MNRYAVTVPQPAGKAVRFVVMAGNATDAGAAARRHLKRRRVDYRGLTVALVRAHPGRRRRG